MNKRFRVQSPFIPKNFWCLGLIKSIIIKIRHHRLELYNKRKKKKKKKAKVDRASKCVDTLEIENRFGGEKMKLEDERE